MVFEFCKLFYKFDKTIISNVGCFKKKYEEDKHDFYNYKEFKQFIKGFDNEIYKQFFNLMFLLEFVLVKQWLLNSKI